MPDVHFESALGTVLVIVVALALAVLWVFQFAALMSLEDGELPGKFSRFGWVAGFVVVWPLAPFAFMLWRSRLPAPGRRSRGERPSVD